MMKKISSRKKLFLDGLKRSDGGIVLDWIGGALLKVNGEDVEPVPLVFLLARPPKKLMSWKNAGGIVRHTDHS